MADQWGTDLVTGGAGFIGSALVRALVSRGRRVIVIDDLSTGRRENLSDLPQSQVDVVVGDISDPRLITPAMAQVDTVYHLACVGLRRSLHAPAEAHRVNASGTLALLMAAQEVDVRRVVHISSSEVYGTALRAPMDEMHPLNPTTPYGASKLAGEAYARAFHLSYGLPVTIVRPFNAYGEQAHHEGDCGEVIPRFALRTLAGRPLVIFGDGCQTRDFTHVRDTVQGIIAAAGPVSAIGETFNLGSNTETSIGDLAQMITSLAGGREAEITYDTSRPGDVRRLVADITKARSVLGYAPKISLAEGLTALIDHYRTRDVPALLMQEVRHNWLSQA